MAKINIDFRELRQIKEIQTVTALLGDYTSESESEEEKTQTPEEKKPNSEKVELENDQKDSADTDEYCPFFPTSQQPSDGIIEQKIKSINGKLKALETKMNVNQSLVEQEKIRFETRLSDWKEGGLSDEFFIKKLESHERALDLRFHDKIDSENTSNKKKRTDTERPDKALLNKGSSTVIESGPVMYKKDDKEFNPLSFVHPERRQFIPSCEEADTNNIPPKRINATTKGADKIEVTASQHRSQADKLIDKWANLRKEEVRMERERNTLEGLEKEREKEIQEWLLTQKKTGETYSNPNFIPLGKGHI